MQDADEVIFEFHQQGNFMKITAVDVSTGLEVVSIAPASLSRHQQMLLAKRKLKYVMEKSDR
ncbi:MAG: DUF6898 family protein [Alphaproteobacteria bacterium]